MSENNRNLEKLNEDGFTTIDSIYSVSEIDAIASAIEKGEKANPSFRKTTDLYAVRRLIKEIPEVKPLLFNIKLKAIIGGTFGEGYCLSKSIYFDKPEKSNWFVAWHQDLTIAVNKRAELPNFKNWTAKSGSFAVQPPLNILQDNFTIRIHLDDTDERNGALKVIPGSHESGVFSFDDINAAIKSSVVCSVKAGGVMIMKPLLMHASNRSVAGKRRRVVHLEFSRAALPEPLMWAEKDYL